MRQREPSFAELRAKTQRLLGFGPSFCFPLNRCIRVKNLADAQRKARASERKIRIKIDGLLIELNGGLQLLPAVVRDLDLDLAGAQIKQVSVGIFRRLGRGDRCFGRCECGAQLARDIDREFALESESVADGALVALAPLLFLVAGARPSRLICP